MFEIQKDKITSSRLSSAATRLPHSVDHIFHDHTKAYYFRPFAIAILQYLLIANHPRKMSPGLNEMAEIEAPQDPLYAIFFNILRTM